MEDRPVNSTARWPERLEHAATLLRAEGAAVLSFQGGELTTLFSYRIAPDVDWTGLVGGDPLRAALAGGAAGTAAIAAGPRGRRGRPPGVPSGQRACGRGPLPAPRPHH